MHIGLLDVSPQVFHSFLWKNPNKGRTYDSTIEFRHYFLEFTNKYCDLY